MTLKDANVCFFGNQLAPSEDGTFVGGSVTSAINLAGALSDRGTDVSVLTTPPLDWDEYRDQLSMEWGEINVIETTAHNHPTALTGTKLFFQGVKELVTFCRRNEIDVIHSHSGLAVLAVMSLTAGKLTATPVVHSLYCPLPESEFADLKDRISSPQFSRLLLSNVDHVVAMSENVHESLHNARVTGPVTTMPPIIDTEIYRPDLNNPESVSIDPDRLSILYVGNLKYSKGLEYLVEGAGLASESIDLELILTDDQRDFPEKRKREELINSLLASHGLEEHTVRKEIIPDMPNLLANVDLVVFPFVNTIGPSDYPVALLEAMACETPVVGTDVGGIPELLGNGRGKIVSPESARAIRDAILNCAESTNQPEQEQARAYVESNFAPDRVAREITAVYHRVVNK